MKPTVYIETTIVSYLTARPSLNAAIAANQSFTKLWWEKRRSQFDLFTSQYVVREASAGDPTAAAARLAVLNEIDLIELEHGIERVADALLLTTALPPKARVDAYHVAAAACNGLEFLMTWNCTHLANAQLWSRIEQVCANEGLEPVMNFQSAQICDSSEIRRVLGQIGRSRKTAMSHGRDKRCHCSTKEPYCGWKVHNRL